MSVCWWVSDIFDAGNTTSFVAWFLWLDRLFGEGVISFEVATICRYYISSNETRGIRRWGQFLKLTMTHSREFQLFNSGQWIFKWSGNTAIWRRPILFYTSLTSSLLHIGPVASTANHIEYGANFPWTLRNSWRKYFVCWMFSLQKFLPMKTLFKFQKDILRAIKPTSYFILHHLPSAYQNQHPFLQ